MLKRVVEEAFLLGSLRVEILSQTLTPIISWSSDMIISGSSTGLLLQAESFSRKIITRQNASFLYML